MMFLEARFNYNLRSALERAGKSLGFSARMRWRFRSKFASRAAPLVQRGVEKCVFVSLGLPAILLAGASSH